MVIQDDRITINHRKTPLLIRTVLISLVVTCGLIPLLATILALSIGKELHIGIFASYMIFWSLGAFMTRIVLWNIYGKELIYLEKEIIRYEPNYKYFKGAGSELKAESINVEIIHNDPEKKRLGHLRIQNGSDQIETVLQSDTNQLLKVKELIESKYHRQ
ncbi:hypothetical protein [Salibacter halophilus]|uniref:DUF304 domain-containing protein n=1 Tax=Salibacter halophilus TaxID=1803916 RepID=A0A6N6MA28_9FLAO|nr:hypothetical protein [Salibacter halophilus]KAB1065570.1 hypothetical protein F3059_02650 [Salibacter halophilus]